MIKNNKRDELIKKAHDAGLTPKEYFNQQMKDNEIEFENWLFEDGISKEIPLTDSEKDELQELFNSLPDE